MRALAGYRVQKQALNGNEALRSKTPTSKAGRRLGDGPRPIGHAGWNRTSGGIKVMPRISRR
jgi:hypothetical protein